MVHWGGERLTSRTDNAASDPSDPSSRSQGGYAPPPAPSPGTACTAGA